MTDAETRIQNALAIAYNHAGIDGAHHKAYIIDQMVRALTGCKREVRYTNVYLNGQFTDTIMNSVLAPTKEYEDFVKGYEAGEDGPDTYEWDKGTPP